MGLGKRIKRHDNIDDYVAGITLWGKLMHGLKRSAVIRYWRGVEKSIYDKGFLCKNFRRIGFYTNILIMKHHFIAVSLIFCGGLLFEQDRF
ncbi:hypothetical protein [Sodalis sp. dw_96]|uniref:hypothetical protein n=1 Tax=Sodalis sp. dw_96 TaxID=2719794 RepID=UPI001BD4A7CD|nr:hypothetical protein [Sodalis sp. dw_96]